MNKIIIKYRSDTESADVKASKSKKYNINFEGLFKKKPQKLATDVEENADGADDGNDDAAPSEATVIIEDDPPKPVIYYFFLKQFYNHYFFCIFLG